MYLLYTGKIIFWSNLLRNKSGNRLGHGFDDGGLDTISPANADVKPAIPRPLVETLLYIFGVMIYRHPPYILLLIQ